MNPYPDLHDPGLELRTIGDGDVTRVVLAGEADKRNLEQLEVGLASISPNGSREIQLDISGLDFVDVAALRRLTLFAREHREAGRRVRTRGAQPMVEQLVRVAGVDDDLGLD